MTSIEGQAFNHCSSLETVYVGSDVRSIGWRAFANTDIANFYCYAEDVPTLEKEVFYNSYPEYATLHVSAASIDAYKANSYWSVFGDNIVALDGEVPFIPDQPKCAAPTIAFENGKLMFACETEGASFVSHIVAVTSGDGDYTGSEVALTPAYTVSVYATANGYQKSDTVTETVYFTGASGLDIDGDGEFTVGDITTLIDAYLTK